MKKSGVKGSRAGSSTRRSKPTVREEIFTGELFSHDRKEQVRGARKKAITRFHEEQQKTRKWIHVQAIAMHCSEADPVLSPGKKHELYINALISLLRSALAGEFELDGRPRLLRAHHDYQVRRAWLNDPDTAPSKAFVSREELQKAVSLPEALPKGGSELQRRKLTSEGKAARFIIANCWVPRDLAVRWLESRRPPISVPAAWYVSPASERTTEADAVTDVDAVLAVLPDAREPVAEPIRLQDEEPKTAPSASAWKALNSLYPKGIPSDLKTSVLTNRVNVWIRKQPRKISPVNDVSRETVARLLGRRK